MVLGLNSSHLEDEFAHETIMRDCNKLWPNLTQDAFIPSSLASLLLSQNEIGLTQHSLFQVNLYRQGASHYDAVIWKTDRAVCGKCIECTEGELPGWQFQSSISFGKRTTISVLFQASGNPLASRCSWKYHLWDRNHNGSSSKCP